MMDHIYTRENGEKILISQMTDREIRHVLIDGVIIEDAGDFPGTKEEAAKVIVKRLEIELIARSLV